jgi:UDP-sulfoquinovose synthase
MRVFICGIDGYLGWSLAIHLIHRGHNVFGIDNFYRRRWVREVGSDSLIPIVDMEERRKIIMNMGRHNYEFGETNSYNLLSSDIKDFQPHAIVHLAEMPSAPYSMMNREKAVYTHTNNVIGTLNILYAMKEFCPDAHLIKIGTMGEYGTPNIDIPEGFFEIEYRGRKDVLSFPKQANSFYHLTKVHDTNNIQFACRTWGLSSTDIMQGVVYGTRIPEMEDNEFLNTRYDYDSVFGTAINRFCVQALIEHPITLYGEGKQKRGFLPLKGSMQCLTLAIENPPLKGEYRVFNQFEQVYSLDELAYKVWSIAREMGYDTKIVNIDNPRTEADRHYYNPDHEKLLQLGYKPTLDIDNEILCMMKHLERHKDRINRNVIMPTIQWK